MPMTPRVMQTTAIARGRRKVLVREDFFLGHMLEGDMLRERLCEDMPVEDMFDDAPEC